MPRLLKQPSKTTVERVEREFFDLFIGLGRGELLPYGSYYLTGFLHERPLARLRDDLGEDRHRARRRRLRAGRSRRHPVRDHVGAGERRLAGAAGFRPHDLRQAYGAVDRTLLRRSGERQAADFYRRLGTLGRIFMDIETEAFELPA